MANEDLVQYIQSQMQQGVAADDILKTLQDAGWQQSDIDEAAGITGLKPAAPAAAPAAGPSHAAMPQTPAMASPAAPAMGTSAGAGQPVDIFDLSAGPASDLAMPGATPAAGAGVPATMPGAAEPQPMTPGMEAMPPVGTPAMSDAEGPKPEFKEGLGTKAKVLLVIIIIGVLLALVGGAAYGYYYIYRSPERALNNMIENLVDMRSTEFEATIKPQGETSGIQEVRLSGAIDGLDGSTAPKAMVTVGLMSEQEPAGTMSVELRSLDSLLYLNVKSIPGLEDGAAAGLTDQWTVFDEATVTQITSAAPLLLGPVTGSPSAQLTADQRIMLRDAFRRANIIVIGDRLGTEEIHDVKSTGYSFTINKEGLKQFLADIRPVLLAHGMSEGDVADAIDNVDDLNLLNGQLWIGNRNFQLYRVHLVIESGSADIEAVDLMLTMWNQNQPVSVEPPEGAVPFEELLGDIFGSVFGGAGMEIGEVIDSTPATEEPATEEPATEEPATEEPATEEPATEEPATEEPATEEPATEEPATEEPATEEPATEEPAEEAPADEEPSEEEPAEEEPGLVEPEPEPEPAPEESNDPDEDGLSNRDEQRYGTDPANPDSDGDGFLDGEEVDNGYNPLGPGRLEDGA
jgi:hypothetical protein